MVISDGIPGVPRNKKTLGIPIQTLPWKRKQLEIPFRGTKIEANSQNSRTPFRTLQRKKKQRGALFRGKKK
jgi:hypothetical protein